MEPTNAETLKTLNNEYEKILKVINKGNYFKANNFREDIIIEPLSFWEEFKKSAYFELVKENDNELILKVSSYFESLKEIKNSQAELLTTRLPLIIRNELSSFPESERLAKIFLAHYLKQIHESIINEIITNKKTEELYKSIRKNLPSVFGGIDRLKPYLNKELQLFEKIDKKIKDSGDYHTLIAQFKIFDEGSKQIPQLIQQRIAKNAFNQLPKNVIIAGRDIVVGKKVVTGSSSNKKINGREASKKHSIIVALGAIAAIITIAIYFGVPPTIWGLIVSLEEKKGVDGGTAIKIDSNPTNDKNTIPETEARIIITETLLDYSPDNSLLYMGAFGNKGKYFFKLKFEPETKIISKDAEVYENERTLIWNPEITDSPKHTQIVFYIPQIPSLFSVNLESIKKEEIMGKHRATVNLNFDFNDSVISYSPFLYIPKTGILDCDINGDFVRSSDSEYYIFSASKPILIGTQKMHIIQLTCDTKEETAELLGNRWWLQVTSNRLVGIENYDANYTGSTSKISSDVTSTISYFNNPSFWIK
jgi:hypothetical protein